MCSGEEGVVTLSEQLLGGFFGDEGALGGPWPLGGFRLRPGRSREAALTIEVCGGGGVVVSVPVVLKSGVWVVGGPADGVLGPIRGLEFGSLAALVGEARGRGLLTHAVHALDELAVGVGVGGSATVGGSERVETALSLAGGGR